MTRLGRDAATEFLRARFGQFRPSVAIVLGSGLGGLSGSVLDSVSIGYSEIPGFPDAKVRGHDGELVFGKLGGVPVLLQSGRFHLYEGHEPAVVVLPVRTFAALGVRTLIVTNAAGGIRSTFKPPAIMLIADHINFMWRNPLLGPVCEGEVRFSDMSDPYSFELRNVARNTALRLGVRIEEGVYAGVLGPSYETPAEIKMLAGLGADAVGMSTVPEVIAARAAGMEVLGISTITNRAAGLSSAKLNHDEVLVAAKQVQADLCVLVEGVVKAVAGSDL